MDAPAVEGGGITIVILCRELGYLGHKAILCA
jgi:hypothetical protein